MAEPLPPPPVPTGSAPPVISGTAPAAASSISAPVVVKIGVRRESRGRGTAGRTGGRGRSHFKSGGRGGRGGAATAGGRGSGLAAGGLVQGPILRHNKSIFAYGNHDPYYVHRNNRYAVVDPRIEELVRSRGPGLFTGCAVLDLGCNSGFISFLVAALGARSVVGVDIDVVQISRALKQLRNLKKAGQRTLLMASQESGGADQFPSCFTRSSGVVPYVFKPLNAGTGATASALAEAAATAKAAAEAVPEESQDLLSLFPHNLEFRTENVLISDIDEQRDRPFDVILCLKLTKWVHLHWGDDGIKVLLHRAWRLLRPGGALVMEVQEWESYQDCRNLTSQTKKMRKLIRLKPEDLITYLVRVIGFEEPDVVGKCPPLKRPLLIYRKPGPPGNAMPAPPAPPATQPAAAPPAPPPAPPLATAALSTPPRSAALDAIPGPAASPGTLPASVPSTVPAVQAPVATMATAGTMPPPVTSIEPLEGFPNRSLSLSEAADPVPVGQAPVATLAAAAVMPPPVTSIEPLEGRSPSLSEAAEPAPAEAAPAATSANAGGLPRTSSIEPLQGSTPSPSEAAEPAPAAPAPAATSASAGRLHRTSSIEPLQGSSPSPSEAAEPAPAAPAPAATSASAGELHRTSSIEPLEGRSLSLSETPAVAPSASAGVMPAPVTSIQPLEGLPHRPVSETAQEGPGVAAEEVADGLPDAKRQRIDP